MCIGLIDEQWPVKWSEVTWCDMIWLNFITMLNQISKLLYFTFSISILCYCTVLSCIVMCMNVECFTSNFTLSYMCTIRSYGSRLWVRSCTPCHMKFPIILMLIFTLTPASIVTPISVARPSIASYIYSFDFSILYHPSRIIHYAITPMIPAAYFFIRVCDASLSHSLNISESPRLW